MTYRTTATKFSVGIPADLASLLENYREENGLQSRSEVVASLEMLRAEALAEA